MTNLEYIQKHITEEKMIIDAIEHFKRIIEATTDTEEKYNEGFVDGLEFCISHLFSMLNVRPEGEWVWQFDAGDPSRSKMLVCSICGNGRNEVGIYNFCPVCGIKMKKIK